MFAGSKYASVYDDYAAGAVYGALHPLVRRHEIAGSSMEGMQRVADMARIVRSHAGNLRFAQGERVEHTSVRPQAAWYFPDSEVAHGETRSRHPRPVPLPACLFNFDRTNDRHNSRYLHMALGDAAVHHDGTGRYQDHYHRSTTGRVVTSDRPAAHHLSEDGSTMETTYKTVISPVWRCLAPSHKALVPK